MIDTDVWRALECALPSYLDRQRWYADKLRPIRALRLFDLAAVERESCAILLSLIDIDFEAGDGRRYFVPVTVRTSPSPERYTIATGTRDSGRFWIQDAPSDQEFRDFLAESGEGITLAGTQGRYEFEPWTLDGRPAVLGPDTNSAMASFEQSNTSIIFDKMAIAKLYRRIETGQNVEVDMNRYLSSEAGFRSIPKLVSCATYRGAEGVMPLILVQQHIGEHRDCWTLLTSMLQQCDLGSLDVIELLGTITGEMHVALANAPAESPLSPEPVCRDDIEGWKAQLLRSSEETNQAIRSRLSSLSDHSRSAANTYLECQFDWNKRSAGFDELMSTFKTRVHGDYHLGQVLVTASGDLMVVDFEGEPQRPAAERAAKYPPLKDVAGMLRSLRYATGMAANSLDGHPDSGLHTWLNQWELDARDRFLAAYRKAIAAAPVPIAPVNDEAFARAVTAFEMDKALYEVRYELSSRPDWAWLPLESLD